MTRESPLRALVVGATGATGRLLVRALLERGHAVAAIVRSPDRLPAELREHPRLAVTTASLLDLDDAELARHVEGCDAIASCLGHSVSVRGIWGRPRRLVTNAVRRLCAAIHAAPGKRPKRFVLMNTAGNRNRDLPEPLSLAERLVVGLIRLTLPPQSDNEQAAEHLRSRVGQGDPAIEWVVVRPDTLLDRDVVSPYSLHASPIRSAIFDPGETSRINIADFMARLIADDALWLRWQGRMPVIYDDGRGTEPSLPHRAEAAAAPGSRPAP